MINTESLRITIKGFVLAINMHQVLASIWKRSQSQKEDNLEHDQKISGVVQLRSAVIVTHLN